MSGKKLSRKSRSSRGPSQRISDRVISVPFKTLKIGSIVTVFSILVSPVLSSRILEQADTFELYRVTRLRFRLHADAQTGGTAMVACYVPGVTDTPPSTVAVAAESLESVVQAGSATMPSKWCNVSRGALASYGGWYKTIPGTPATSEEIQGTIFVVPTGTQTYVLEVEGIFEFKAPVDPAATPAIRRAKQLAAEFQRLQVVCRDGPFALKSLTSPEPSPLLPSSSIPAFPAVPAGFPKS